MNSQGPNCPINNTKHVKIKHLKLNTLSNFIIVSVLGKKITQYAFHQTPTSCVRMERILFIKEFLAEKCKTIKYEIRDASQKYSEANMLNQIHNVIIILNNIWYELTYRLYRRGTIVY